MVSGIIDILYWWFIVTAIGLIAVPLTRRFFNSFPDRGYIVTKLVGLAFVCYFNWLICSLHIIPFSILSVLVSVGLLAAISFILGKKSLTDTVAFFRSQSRFVLLTEIIFLTAFLFFGIIRMCNPDIASTEKMPDFAFLSGILNSEYFPPKDPWYVGESINYFYYGHYHIAMLSKLSGLAPEYTYNLGIALIFALTLLGATGVSYGLTRRLKYGFLGGLFVAFIGNLDGCFQVLNHMTRVIFSGESFYPFNWFNWWQSSRVIVREGIDITINEFPFWSYVLGDLHAHVNVVPFSILTLAIVLELFRGAGNNIHTLGRNREWIYRLIFTAIALGTIPTANTWDTPIYFALVSAAMIYGRQFYLKPPEKSFGAFVFSPVKELWAFIRKRNWPVTHKDSYTAAFKGWFISIIAIILTLVLAYSLFLPFHLNFHPVGAQGVRLVNKIQRTIFADFITIYGFFFYCLISFASILLWTRLKRIPNRLLPITIGSLIIGIVFIKAIFGTVMIALCLLLLFALFFIPLNINDYESNEKFFTLSLFLVVLVILLGCEFVYIKDAYGKTLERQNTIFKFYYQAWIFCGISSAYAIYWIRENVKDKIHFSWESIFRLLLIATLAFPVLGTTVKCNHFAALKPENTFTKATLEGIWYMSWRFKDDYAAIQYLKKHAQKNDVVLEATGPAFSHYGRISASTGLSTVLGWGNHENIWRDGTWKEVGNRSNDTKLIYTSSDQQECIELFDKYKIDYVFVGHLEREQYPNADFEKFKRWMTPVLEIEANDNQTSYLYKR